jgi:hypothetical protein
MSTNDDADGGFGRPPNVTRFKKGQSGNPGGRPKGTRNLKTDLASLLQKRVPIREDGELRHVSRQEAMLLTLYAKAVQGDTKASGQLFGMLAKLENQGTASSQPDVVTENDRAIVEDFLRRNSAPIRMEGKS